MTRMNTLLSTHQLRHIDSLDALQRLGVHYFHRVLAIHHDIHLRSIHQGIVGSQSQTATVLSLEYLL